MENTDPTMGHFFRDLKNVGNIDIFFSVDSARPPTKVAEKKSPTNPPHFFGRRHGISKTSPYARTRVRVCVYAGARARIITRELKTGGFDRIHSTTTNVVGSDQLACLIISSAEPYI